MMAITTSSSTSVNARRSGALSTEEDEDMAFSNRIEAPSRCPLHQPSRRNCAAYFLAKNTPRTPRFAERKQLASPAPLLLFLLGNSLTLAADSFKLSSDKTA